MPDRDDQDDERQYIAFSPHAAFGSTVNDLVEITAHFRQQPDPTNDQQATYLKAVDGLLQQATDVISTIHSLVVQPVIMEKVDHEILEHHVAASRAKFNAELTESVEEIRARDYQGITEVMTRFGGIVAVDEDGRPKCDNPDHDHSNDE